MKNLIRYSTQATLLAVLATQIIGCGGFKSNPTENYSDLKGWGKPTDQKLPELSFIQSSIFSIQSEKNLTFVEGQKDTYLFKPELKLTGVEYVLSAKGLPDGATFVAATEPELVGQYKLTWAPKVGLLTDQESYRPYPFQIEITVTKTSDEKAAQVMKTISAPREMSLQLVRTSQQPVVEKVDLASGGITEGDTVAFTVLVRDTGSPAGVIPSLIIHNEENPSKASATIEVASRVSIDQKVDVLGQGEFRFSGKLSTKDIVLPGKEAEVPAHFVVGIKSVSKLPSTEQIVEVKVSRKVVAPPVLPPPATTKVEVTAKAPSKTPVKAKTAKRAKTSKKTKRSQKAKAKTDQPETTAEQSVPTKPANEGASK
jgi:hypothetical protein